ncbi:MAG: nucleotidyltransferase domain-containing protein [Bacteroidaceae bacterium]|nr:nucleotidyltransferase domain-containing protein [Bacteroidaceae bacterium]
MDSPKVLTRDEAIDLVRQYKQVISPRFNGQAKVMMFGSYSKGYPNPWSDIDVAVIVPTVAEDKWLETSIALGKDSDKVSLLIEPVLLAEDHWSPLYDDVMQTGVAV